MIGRRSISNAAPCSGSSLLIPDTGTTADIVSLGYTGLNTISGLTYNGTSLAAGIYTPAALNTATGSTDFSLTGNRLISGAAFVPEPDSLIATGLGRPVALAFRRRKNVSQ